MPRYLATGLFVVNRQRGIILLLELGLGSQQCIALHLVRDLGLLLGQRLHLIGLDLLMAGIDQQLVVLT